MKKPDKVILVCCSYRVGNDAKGKLSVVLYAVAILCALLVNRWLAEAIYIFVALMWLVPDRRIERVLTQKEK